MISSILLTFILIIFVSLNNTNNENKNVLSNTNKDTEVINSNMITMMYETDAGTGVYEETRDTSWPESGYIFNNNLSGCENGGELEYNSINNTVNLLSNKSDNCYVYFDKYDGVWIDNVSVTNVTGSSVTLDISATSENGSITTYYYSLNDSEEYQETTSNPITINDLNKLTEYKISIYAIDSTNARSNIYEVMVTTTDESGPVINSVSVSNITTSGFTLTVDATSDVGIERYYYIIESENIAGTSTSNTYTFDGLEIGTTYNIVVFAKDNNNNQSSEYELEVGTESTLLLAEYIKSLYSAPGVNDLYHHTSDLTDSAGDNSYRYSGANPNNYVCFGSNASTCPSDNLYRIIGVFGDEVKLIKYDYANSNLLGTNGDYYGNYGSLGSYYKGSLTSVNGYYWNASGSNTWSASSLNTVNLNTNFLNSLGSTWSNLIANHSWKVGGMSLSNGRSNGAQTAYNYEVGSSSSSTTYSAKVGLMYLSDYYYAATNAYWTYPGYSTSGASSDYRAATSYNWMYMGLYEWTISRSSDDSGSAFRVNSTGAVVDYSYVTYYYTAVRPSFYLNSSVNYVSGSGTQSDPFRIQ